MTSQEVFDTDRARLEAAIAKLGAVVTFDDGTQGIDPTIAPASLIDTYSNLLSYGYANGLLR
jgi:hypothetical protein